MKNKLNSSHPFALTTILFWAPTYVMSHMIAPYISPAALGCLRYTIAGVILALILGFRKISLPERKDIPFFAIAAICGFSLYMIVFNYGTALVTSATSSVIIAMTPVFTGILASVFFKEKLTVLQWLAMAVQFSGVLVLVLVGKTVHIVVVAIPNEVIRAELINFAAMLWLLFFLDVILKVLKRNFLFCVYGVVDCVHDIVDILVSGFNSPFGNEVSFYRFRLRLTCQLAELGDQFFAFLFGDELQ